MSGKRVYSREELLEVASLMGVLDAQVLDEHKNYDYKKQTEMLTAPAELLADSGPRSLSNFGRKRSDLESKTLDSSMACLANQRKLCRMLSSPLIRSNRGAQASGETTAENDASAIQNLSPQVRLKYARLVESCSQNRARQEQRAASSVPRRPESLFGPLRQRPEESRMKISDEPMSLPYSINTTRANEMLPPPPQHAAKKWSLTSEEAPDWRRSDTNQSYEFKADRDEEDDFDISSLLSITVLSDIRFIRQELNQMSSLKASATTRPSGKSLQRNRLLESSSGGPVRMLPRSRTSLEFNLGENRRTANQNLNRDSLAFQRAHTNLLTHSFGDNNQRQSIAGQLSYDPYSSLNETASLPYTWQANSLVSSKLRGSTAWCVDPQVALEYHLKCAKDSKSSELSDDSRKGPNKSEDNADRRKIIEAFKAQLQARANERPVEKVERGETGEKGEVETCEVAAAEPKVEPARDETSKPGEQTPVSADAKSSTWAPRASNIPRLISLHRASARSTSKDAGDESRDKAPDPPAAGQTIDRRANIKPGQRFVSRYKLMRGKSLADEVEESAPS